MHRERFDHVVLGAGLRGLAAALAHRRERPEASLLVIDAAPHAGGSVRTQRSNGFVCELGPFAFARGEIAPLLAALDRPPPLVEPLPEGRRGWRFDGGAPTEGAGDPLPVSFASGTEELPQACRRELGAALRLGRTAAALRPTAAGWEIELGGEAATCIDAARVTLALPATASARLLGAFDRELPNVAARVGAEPRAFVFVGGHGGAWRELRGHGVLPTEAVDTPVAELLFCTQVFARRALSGRTLVRAEVAAADAGDAALVPLVLATLQAWTGVGLAAPSSNVAFSKVHRFAVDADPGAAVELQTRLGAVAARCTGLALA